MNAFNQLLHWDSQALLWINSHHTPVWDQIMWYASQSWVWIPLYVLLIYVISKVAMTLLDTKSEDRQRVLPVWKIILLVFVAVACIAAAAGLSDYVTSGLLKKWICRPRPTHSGIASHLHILHGYTGGKYGFPSSHAANTMAVAVAFWTILNHLLRLPHRVVAHNTVELTGSQALITLTKLLVIIYVVLNCYSRMYLGVHYPLDILCGALIGALFGFLFALIFKSIYRMPEKQLTFLYKPTLDPNL